MRAAREATRERILDAALDLFGERGLTGTTVRDIAARAKVNVAAISYHFGGKDELYRAVARDGHRHDRGRVRERAAPLLDNPPADAAAALAALEELAETVVDVIVGPPEMRRVARFIIREQMQPTAAFEILFGTIRGCCTGGLPAVRRWPPGSSRKRRRRGSASSCMIGQAIFLRIAEAAVLRRMQLERYDEEFLAEVKTLLQQNLRAIVAAAREGRP